MHGYDNNKKEKKYIIFLVHYKSTPLANVRSIWHCLTNKGQYTLILNKKGRINEEKYHSESIPHFIPFNH